MTSPILEQEKNGKEKKEPQTQAERAAIIAKALASMFVNVPKKPKKEEQHG